MLALPPAGQPLHPFVGPPRGSGARPERPSGLLGQPGDQPRRPRIRGHQPEHPSCACSSATSQAAFPPNATATARSSTIFPGSSTAT